MLFDSRVTVVVPAHDEAQTIEDVVREFSSETCVERTIVVENNCADDTAELARRAGAEVVSESAPGYGCAIRAGLDVMPYGRAADDECQGQHLQARPALRGR